MLTCIYHPIDHFRVVEHDEAESLIESGVWFDCPRKARDYRNAVEDDIKKENDAPEKKKPGRKPKGEAHEG